jgi:hypothetical protein
LSDIIARKTKEIDDAGFGMWGYGGNTCHPASMVQPFAQAFAEKGEPIHLVMEEMNSRHFAEPLCAAEYSVDGRSWEKIPDPINVRGSRFALMIRNLRPAALELPLTQTQVAIGPNTGKLGTRYLQGQVDKACLEIMPQPELSNELVPPRPIGLVADLVEPYAVFLRNYR